MKRLKNIVLGLLIVSGLMAQSYPPEEFQKVAVIFTNDIHGGIARTEATFMNPQFPPKLGGAAVAVRYINQVREQAQEEGFAVLAVDEGDFFSGTPVGTKTAGAAVIDYMNLAGYDLSIAGNHDFDQGWWELRDRAKEAEFPILAANIVDDKGEIVPFLKPYIIKEYNGIRVGILGLATSVTPNMSFPANVEGMNFMPEIATAKKWLPIMKKEGVDVTILCTHAWTPYNRDEAALEVAEQVKKGIFTPDDKLGMSGLQIAAAVPGIDIMFTGHVHKGFRKPYEDPVNHTLIFQNYGNGSNLGHVNFYIHRKTGTLAGYDYEVDNTSYITLLEDEFWIDTLTDRVIQTQVDKAEEGFDQVITVLEKPLRRANEGQSVLGNTLCDAMTWATGADVAFSNYGGLRSDLEAGPLTYEAIFRFLPFGNQVVVFKMSGKELHQLIENRVMGNSRGMLSSGLEVVIDKRRPDGDRVNIKTVQGKAFDMNASYKLAVSDYLAEGNSGYDMLAEIDPGRRINTGRTMRDAFRDYLMEFGNTGSVDQRWIIIK